MRRLLLRQSLFLPLAALLLPILIGFGVPGYSSLTQHVSELQLLDHPVAGLMRIAPVVCGVSILLFGIAAWLTQPLRCVFTALASAAVATNFVTAGIWVSGSPMHGLYGIGLLLPLAPACFAAESGLGLRVQRISLAVAFACAVYLWLNLSGLDPVRGLTQRLLIVLIMGWYAYASFELLKAMRPDRRLAGNSATNAAPITSAR